MTAVDEFPAPDTQGTPVCLAPADLPDIVGVFSDAFRDYPVMRYVLGSRGLYDQRLDRLVELL